MRQSSLGSATSIVILASSALLAGCASTQGGRCDTSHSVGSCAVTVQMQGTRLVVCPVENAASSPVCMNAAVDVQRAGQKPQQMQVMLEPGHCQPLSTEVMSAATSGSCQAFAARTHGAPVESTASTK